MSTRCQIGFYNNEKDPIDKPEALIYRHSDGYPGDLENEWGVLQDIVPFLKWFKAARGLNDTEYVAARLLQWLCNQYDGFVQMKVPYDFEKKPFTGTLGHGISKEFHDDIEFYYRVYPDVLEVYDIDFDSKPKDWKKIQTIELCGTDAVPGKLDELISSTYFRRRI